MRKKLRKHLKWLIPLLVLVLLAGAFLIYTAIYYHADETALAALASDDRVRVSRVDCGWFFDGPSGTDALIFYPGAKVEAEAYAPLLHTLAAEGTDVFLVEMPFRLAIFGKNKAEGILSEYDYDRWYIGGHSLGGAMAASYAAAHPERLTGVLLLAAYPTKRLDESLTVVSIYGSEDGVLNLKKVAAGRDYAPAAYYEYVIPGGNHAQFGNYGPQSGDNPALISAEEQQKETAAFFIQNKGSRREP